MPAALGSLLDDTMMAQMQASAMLAALLAKDPNDPAGKDLAILPARMNAVLSPVYRCITFREQSDAPDGRFRPQPPGLTTAGVTDTYFDFEAWDNLPNTRGLKSIRDALDALFHQQAFPLYATPGPITGPALGRVLYCERLMSSINNYDDVMHCFYGLMRYRFRVETF